MSALTICSCTLNIKDQLGAALGSVEIVMEPRKTQIHSGDSIYIGRPQRNTSAPGIVVQDLLYISKTVAPLTPVTITYTAGGTAGSEVVTLVGTAISVQIESGVSTATQVRTAVLASVTAAALVNVIISGISSTAQVSQSVTALSASYCYLPLSETTTDSQQVIFTINYYDEGKYYNSIIFDPILIPNQAYLDLSTLLTISRG